MFVAQLPSRWGLSRVMCCLCWHNLKCSIQYLKHVRMPLASDFNSILKVIGAVLLL